MALLQGEFAARLRYARAIRKLSQLDVAEATGIHRVNIGQYERGTVYPSIETFAMLVQFYNISADYLLGLSNEPHLDRPKK